MESFIKESSSSMQTRKIDWVNAVMFYEDSEGDLNVISDEQDIKVAQTYSFAKNLGYLKCSVVPRETFN